MDLPHYPIARLLVTVMLASVLLLLNTCGMGEVTNQSTRRSFDVKHFGAVGDGKHNDTCCIQQAIDACFAAGGGTVTFAPGTYLTGSIAIKRRGAGSRGFWYSILRGT
jgi:hypothetical protein